MYKLNSMSIRNESRSYVIPFVSCALTTNGNIMRNANVNFISIRCFFKAPNSRRPISYKSPFTRGKG